MDFFTGFGFAADASGFAGMLREKLKKANSDWKELLSFLKKIIKAVCKDYSDFIAQSPDHRDIRFPNDYETLLFEAICTALSDVHETMKVHNISDAIEKSNSNLDFFSDEINRNDTFALLLRCAESDSTSYAEAHQAIWCLRNLRNSHYRSTRDVIMYRIIQIVESLAIKHNISMQYAHNNIRTQCFYIARLIKHYELIE